MEVGGGGGAYRVWQSMSSHVESILRLCRSLDVVPIEPSPTTGIKGFCHFFPQNITLSSRYFNVSKQVYIQNMI